MKQPQLKKLWFGSYAAVEIFPLCQLAPSSDESAWNVSIKRSFGSSRLSNQIACRPPASSAAIHGKNWSCGAAAPVAVVDSVWACDQVAPKSFDCENEMSVPEVKRLTSFR